METPIHFLQRYDDLVPPQIALAGHAKQITAALLDVIEIHGGASRFLEWIIST